MYRLAHITALSLACALALAACTKSTQPTTSATPEPSGSAVASATESPGALASGATPTSAEASASPTSEAAASPAASGATEAPAGVVSFTDVSGVFAEQQINALGQLGVFDSTTGTFQPNGTIKRSEFVRWLVKANNALFKDDPSKQIRPAEGTLQTFTDVPPTHPDYKYVQALANAGFVVGIDDQHFAPDANLTREQMIAIKVPVDLGGAPYKNEGLADVHAVFPFSDIDKISKRYYDAIYGDDFDGSKNITRTFGEMKTFQPQRPVTRSEAALCISTMGNYGPKNAVQAVAKPTPAQ
jgi:hypothetical protein